MLGVTGGSSRRHFLKEFSWLGSATILFQISRVGTELVVAKILGPDTWGIWYFLNLILAYRSFIHLGVINGLNREVPVLIGKGKKQKAFELQNSALMFLVVISIGAGVILSLGYYLVRPELFSDFIAPMILLLLLSQLFDYLSVIYTTRLQFEEISKIKIIYALTAPLFILPLVFTLGLIGLVYGISAAYTLIVAIFFYQNRKWKPAKFRMSIVIELVQIGFPIMLVGVAYTVLLTVDRIVIGAFLGVREVGIYSLTIILFGMIVLFPRIINQQFYPRMAIAYGKTGSFDSLIEMINMQRKYILRIMIILVFAVNILFSIAVPLLFPEYEEGLPALMIVSFSGLSICFSAGWSTYLHLINKQSVSLKLIVAALIINVGISSFLLKMELQLVGVAIGTTVSFVLFNVGLMYFGKHYSKME